MTLYEFLNQKETLSTIVKLIRNNTPADTTTILYVSIYDRFYELKGKKMERYDIVASEFNITPRQVRTIITKLNTNIK